MTTEPTNPTETDPVKVIEVKTEIATGGEEALKRQVDELRQNVSDLEKNLTHANSEVERINGMRNTILEEKRTEVAKLKALQILHDGLSPEQVEAALNRARQGDEAVEQQVRDIVNSRIKDYKEDTIKPIQDENVSLRNKNEGLRKKLSESLVTREIYENAKKNGAKSGMIKYFVYEFADRIDVDSNGDPVYRNADGHQIEGINWEHEMIKLREKSPGLFEHNKGSRAASASSPNEGGLQVSDNPWSPEQFNISRQVIIEGKDPDLAKKLIEEAKKANQLL